jgi:hypothetical protein
MRKAEAAIDQYHLTRLGSPMKRSLVGLIVLLVMACAYVTPTATKPPTGSPVSSVTSTSGSTSPDSHLQTPGSPNLLSTFAFGVEYAVPGLAEIYAQAGARSTRAAAETFGWDQVEPRPPAAGQHAYDWAKVDAYIMEYQNAGFDQIQIYTTALNKWASSKPKHYFPDHQYLADYENYILTLVERYDGDGKDDAPGLKYPVLDYVIEREWTEFFPGTTDEYLQLLTIGHRAAKSANPNARVWLVPLMMIDVFDRNPTADQVAQRAAINYVFRHPIAETQELLTHPELFDVIEIHALGDYTEIEATAAWLRAQMKQNGYDKPIFIGDAMGISQGIWAIDLRALTPLATDSDFLTFAPLRPNDAIRFINLLEAMKDPGDPQHDAATHWFRAEHARALTKKIAAAMQAGYAGMNVWALADIPVLQSPRVTSDWFFMGMIESKLGLGTFTPGAPRPAYYALKMTIEKLNGATSAEKLNLGGSLVAYQFVIDGNPVLVAWNEPGQIYFPEETEPTVRVNLLSPGPNATVTHVITELGISTPRVETIPAVNGTIPLGLDSTPVFVEFR